MAKILRWYQEDARRYGRNRSSIFLAMEMRLGKTLTTLRILDDKDVMVAIILAPKTTLISWEEELESEGKSFVNLAKGSVSSRLQKLNEIGEEPCYYLLNYETLRNSEVRRYLDRTERFPFQALVCDESTQLKNHGAQATKTLMRICDRFEYRICLSGLPTPQSWFDIWSQMAIACGGHWMGASSYWKWRNKNSEPEPDGYGRWIPPKMAVKIKEAFHKDAFVLSRKDANLAETRITQIRKGELETQERRLYDIMERDWEIPGIALSDTNETNFKMVVQSWQRRICGGHLPSEQVKSWKYAELSLLLEGQFRNERVVVWFAFNAEIDRCAQMHKDRAFVLDGDTPSEERRDIINSWRSSSDGVMFIQMKLGKFGLNLSAADTAIYFSLTFDLEEYNQSSDRIVMPGKPSPLLFIHLLTKDTIEEDIYDAILDKKIDAKWLLRRMDERRSRIRWNGVGGMERKTNSEKRVHFFIKKRGEGLAESRDVRGQDSPGDLF